MDFITTWNLSHRITPEDFPRIEEEMKRVVKENQVL
jgi:threonyl-tRNA synthetase